MSKLNELFLRRIGLPEDMPITFEALGRIMEQTAYAIPFENLCIMEQRVELLTMDNISHKILHLNEGGLCYEVNPLLYEVLRANGFDVSLVLSIVYYPDKEAYSQLGHTHVVVLLKHEDQTYLIDSGYGGNLALQLIPFTGETVTSANGEFRIRPLVQEHGDYVLEMKLTHRGEDWRVGYALDSRSPIGFEELRELQRLIAFDERSYFNKDPLITKRTERGGMTLTNTSFTVWEDGVMTKEEIKEDRFQELYDRYFR